ncbi:MAG: glucose-1-phosphate thymidylyltransferase RfbA [Myxococcota bacterium]
MKGILLAGGYGRRLGPATRVVSKQLLPVYDKPMVYYPLSLLMLAGIRDVLLVATPAHLPWFQELFGDGSRLGIRMEYVEQPRPEGLAHAFVLGREYLEGGPACLVLGDNLLYGHGLSAILQQCAQLREGATIFGYKVSDPRRYGVVEFDAGGRVTDVVEKPAVPRSHYAVPGIYFYGPDVCDLAATLRPSERGELEIADLNRLYLKERKLEVQLLGRGYAWLDAGTPGGLAAAAGFIEAIQQRQGLIVGCLEEIAWDRGWIDAHKLRESIRLDEGSAYGRYLASLLDGSPDFPVSSRRRRLTPA